MKFSLLTDVQTRLCYVRTPSILCECFC